MRPTAGAPSGDTPEPESSSGPTATPARPSKPTPQTSPSSRGQVQRQTAEAKILAALLQGASVKEACEAAGVYRQRYYDWRLNDEEFRRQIDDAVDVLSETLVADAIEYSRLKIRDLVPKAVAALEAGIESTIRVHPMKQKVGEHEEEIVLVQVPDRSLSVRSSDLLVKLVQELQPKRQVEVTGLLEHRLAELGDSPSD